MGGGGSSSNDNQNNWFTMQLMDQWQKSIKDAATAQQQQMGGLQLDWLRNYGQTPAMKAALIPAPFSTVAGGLGSVT